MCMQAQGMEKETRKRRRGELEEENKELFVKNAAKKEDDVNYDESDRSISLGVFDFPWLHEHDEGIISELSDEYWNFQDSFSSSLDDTCPQTEVEFSRQFLYEIPTSNSSMSLRVPDNKFEESVDCIWSSLHNQPLQPND